MHNCKFCRPVKIGRSPADGTKDTRVTAYIPNFLPERGWRVEPSGKSKGYIRWNVRTNPNNIYGLKMNDRLHRVVMTFLLGRKLNEEEVIHHQDFDKANCCGSNLLMCNYSFNPIPSKRDPYTGQWMGMDEFNQRYGSIDGAEPDWVRKDYGEVAIYG